MANVDNDLPIRVEFPVTSAVASVKWSAVRRCSRRDLAVGEPWMLDGVIERLAQNEGVAPHVMLLRLASMSEAPPDEDP